MGEYRALGHDEFLKHYKFREARTDWVVHQGRGYDAKAIVGVAHGYARPDLGPLTGGLDRYTTRHARRVLKRHRFQLSDSNSSHRIPQEAADDRVFDPANVKDSRERTERAIYRRRGQKQFRDALLAAYEEQCAVTGCAVRDVPEAAHVVPYRGDDTNQVENGLLLRSDIHTLFDLGLLSIDADSMTVLVATELENTEYGSLLGRGIRPPRSPTQKPGTKALRAHTKRFGWAETEPE